MPFHYSISEVYHMARLPKSIIKQYGISKKAWAVFRSRKSTKKTISPQASRPKKRSGYSMARRKSTSRRTRRVSRALKPTNMIIGAAAYAMLEPTVNNLASRVGMGMSDDVIKGVGGYFLAKKRGIVGGIGSAALTISIYKLAARQGGLFTASNGQGVATSGATFA